MRQVRLALGPDALVVSNRRVNGGVEILATDATSLSDAENAAAGKTAAPPAVAPSAAPTQNPVPAPGLMPRPMPAAGAGMPETRPVTSSPNASDPLAAPNP